MKRLLLVALAALLATLGGLSFAAPARACSCAAPPLEDLLEGSDFVGMVTPRSAITTTPPTRIGQRRYAVTVDRVYRGDVDATATVITAEDPASCGTTLRPGESQLAVASIQGRMLRTSLCSTRHSGGEVTADDVERVLGPGRPPVLSGADQSSADGPPSDTAATPRNERDEPLAAATPVSLIIGLGALGMLVGMLLLVRRRAVRSARLR